MDSRSQICGFRGKSKPACRNSHAFVRDEAILVSPAGPPLLALRSFARLEEGGEGGGRGEMEHSLFRSADRVVSGRRSVGRGMGCSVGVRECEGKGAAVSGDFGVPGFEVIRRIVIEFFWGKRCGYFGKPVYLESVSTVYCELNGTYAKS